MVLYEHNYIESYYNFEDDLLQFFVEVNENHGSGHDYLPLRCTTGLFLGT